MAFDVEGSHVQEVGIVPEETEALVAALTEQLPDPTSRMIMIKVLRRRIPTDAASVLLRCS
jgi:hypothetical protein